MKLFYDAWYRFGTPPWAGEPREDLIRLVTDGTLQPGRAIDLGCGEGDNAIYLAQHGFTVTGIDFAPSAIAKAKRKAAAAGVSVDFRVDDLMHLKVRGPFDLLVDYGTLDDLSPKQRDQYIRQVQPLAHTGSQFLLWCFEWTPTRRERLLTRILPFGSVSIEPGEVERRFWRGWKIDKVSGEQNLPTWPRGWACYVMTRRMDPIPSPGPVVEAADTVSAATAPSAVASPATEDAGSG
jgi:SAM-dependent methyltransferase